MTDNGRIIFEFLADVVQGMLEGATLWHRLEATRQLRAFGIEIPVAVIEAAEKAAKPRTQSAAAARAASTSAKNELAEFVRNETDNGKDVLRFLVDVVQDRVADAKELRHYLLDRCDHTAAGEEWDDEEWDDDDDEEKILNDEDDPFDFENYGYEQYRRDRNGRRAVDHIFGGQEGGNIALETAFEYRTGLRNAGISSDFDETPIENPEDDPHGKGCYGYKALIIAIQENGAVREANKAVLEHYRRKFNHLLNEDGALAAGDETASLDPKTLQYLERNRHFLAAKNGPPQDPDPTAPITHEPGDIHVILAPPDSPSPTTPDHPVGEGFKPSRDHAHPSTEPTEEPPNRHRRKKPRRIIHLGPPDEEDPQDDNPRPYRDPDEIRVPLRDLVRFPSGSL